jgi:NAD(P)-dependent dehydrogenase (short-subunit alcohol dehydrogenase family)
MSSQTDLSAASLFNIKGWVAVVTGGGSGLGLVTANTLAANGVKVYITGRRADKLKDAEKQDPSGGSIIALQMDVTDKESIQAGVDEIAKKEKFVNVRRISPNKQAIISLTNRISSWSTTPASLQVCSKSPPSTPSHPLTPAQVNYGPSGHPKGSPAEISKTMMNNQTFDDWTWVYKVASYYFTSAAFLPLLCAAKDNGFPEVGSILNISSISGITKESQNGQFSYNASKAGTISLTEQLAVDLKHLEVRVNTLAPGYL